MNPKQQDILLQKISLRYARKLKKEINRYISLVSRTYGRELNPTEKYFPQHKVNMFYIWEDFAKKTIKLFGEAVEIKGNTRSYNYLHTRKNDFPTFFDYLYNQWVKKNGGSHIVSIAETTRNKINKIIREETQGEVSAEDISKRIGELKGFTNYRAKTIALTETHMAAQFSSHETAVKLETDNDLLVYKEWVPVEDERTRQSHAEMADYGSILLHEMFEVESNSGIDLMEYPSDPNGSPENIIRCRCSLVYVTED